MEYNTQRNKLVFPEYGRHIQKMVDYCKTIKDKDERTRNAYLVISIMGNMHPHLRDVPEFNHKLWNHLAILADYDLDIHWPYPLPDKNEKEEKPERVPYSDNKIRARHYGKNLEKMLTKINNYENEEEREALILLIANYMKKLYFTWKKEHVEDKIIFDDIERLTKNAFEIPENAKLNDAYDLLAGTQSAQPSRPKRRKSRKRN